MKTKNSKPWWLRKRILFPLALVVGVAVAAAVAFSNSDVSTIVIYNQTGNPLPPLLVRACGQARSFAALADQESVQIRLKPTGGETAVHLELAANPPWQWDGETIKPRGGISITIHLLPSGQVEAFTAVSWWRRIWE